MARRESFSSTSIFFPALFISGISACGGDTTTFSVALSILTNSSKKMLIFCCLTFVAPSSGDAPMTLGGVSSYHPPSG